MWLHQLGAACIIAGYIRLLKETHKQYTMVLLKQWKHTCPMPQMPQMVPLFKWDRCVLKVWFLTVICPAGAKPWRLDTALIMHVTTRQSSKNVITARGSTMELPNRANQCVRAYYIDVYVMDVIHIDIDIDICYI